MTDTPKFCQIRTLAYPQGSSGQRECIGDQCAQWLPERAACVLIVLAQAAAITVAQVERQESREDLAESVRLYHD